MCPFNSQTQEANGLVAPVCHPTLGSLSFKAVEDWYQEFPLAVDP